MASHSIPRQRIVGASGVRVDVEDSTGQKMLIMGTLKKFEKSIMECLYKFMYSNVNG
jgi:hypothetical protein